MYELLRRVADRDPERTATFSYAADSSYGQLERAARRAAASLRAHGVTRFAIADHAIESVVPLLAGAALIGVEACQYPQTSREETAGLLEQLDHEVLVTDREDLGGAAARTFAAAELIGGEAQIEADTPLPDSRPHLVLTTGTTGRPKGVMHDWNRLLRATGRTPQTPDQRWLLAYGLQQFGGQQVLIHVFAAGAALVAPSLPSPREGLRAMRDFEVTHVSATPTYWRFVLAELRADGGPVPRPRQITMGGEAVPGRLLAELRATFPEVPISQVYGASEFGTTGTTRDDRPGLPLSVLDRGPDADVQMKIVDGQLWVRSRIGMIGYYGEPPVGDEWRPTGDLVDVVDDRIVFRGRASQIINVGGLKVHPLPIEERIGALPDVAVARVYGRSNPVTGSIVALEVVPQPGADPDRLKAAIRESCADLPSAAQPRSIRLVEDISTTGGKIVRR